MRTCAAKAQIVSKCRIRHSSQSAYFDAVALRHLTASYSHRQKAHRLRASTPGHSPAMMAGYHLIHGEPGWVIASLDSHTEKKA